MLTQTHTYTQRHWPWIPGLQEVPGTLSPTVTLCSLGTISHSVCVRLSLPFSSPLPLNRLLSQLTPQSGIGVINLVVCLKHAAGSIPSFCS